jgi:uncharacterized protein YbbK (DUF523 family)
MSAAPAPGGGARGEHGATHEMTTQREKILVSACLLGERVRHDAGHKASEHSALQRWAEEGRLVPVCPEVAGGLGVPRPPAEIQGPGGGPAVLAGTAPIHTRHGQDVTGAFLAGARAALAAAERHGIRIAILKEGSPSCGSSLIHDGTFAGVRIPGMGATTAMLRAAGIEVFSETEIDAAAARLAELEGTARDRG